LIKDIENYRKNQEKNMQIVLLSHMFNNGNLGVGALSISNLLILADTCKSLNIKPKFYLFSYKNNGIDYSYELDKYNIDYEIVIVGLKKYVLDFNKIYNIIKSSNIVIDIGAGDSFSDIYGMSRILNITIPEILTIIVNKPLVLSPQTIGPFDTFLGKTLAKYILNRSKLIIARDNKSFQITKSYLSEKKHSLLKESIDVAMLLPYEKNTDNKHDNILVGLNVSGLLYNGGYTKNNQFGLSINYVELIHKLINYFKSISSVELTLVSHVLEIDMTNVENDYSVCSKLGKEFDIKISPFFKSPIEAKSYISKFDFFMGARMHATIGAFSSGVPVVPMAYSRKFESLFHGLDYNYVIDMTKKDENEVFDFIIKNFENRDKLKKDAEISKLIALKKLDIYKEELKKAINECK
jgi:polysaccharide pyruvyl transferase WcaK-like protein